MKRNTFLSHLNPLARRTANSSNLRRGPYSSRRLSFEGLETRTLLAVFTVTSTADTVDTDKVDLTLREAILEANANPNTDENPDTIEFNINGGGAQTITLGADLPPLSIKETAIIDGATQPGYSETPLITIDAAAITTWEVMGLRSGAGGSELRNFQISNTPIMALVLTSDDGGCLVENLDLSGPGKGMWILSDGNTIRGLTASTAGQAITTIDANGNTIEWCDLSDSGWGVALGGDSSNNLIQHNDASGVYTGVSLGPGANNTVIDNDFSNAGIGIYAQYGLIEADHIEELVVARDNVFTNTVAVQLNGLHDIALAPGPDFDIDVRDARSGLVLVDASNVTIDGFDLSGDGTRWAEYDRGLGLRGTNTNITIQNIISRDRGIGIQALGLTDSEISNADLSWTGDTPIGRGLQLPYGSGNTVRNVVSTNRKFGIEVYSSHDNLIETNTLSGGSQGVTIYSSTGNTSTGNTVRNNDVSNSLSGGIVVYGDSSNNLIELNNASGSLYGILARSVGSGNQYLSNDLSQTTNYALEILNETLFVVSGNDFSNSFGGVRLGNMDGLDLSPNPDFDIDVSTTGHAASTGALALSNMSNSTISGFDLSAMSPAAQGGAGLVIGGGANNLIEALTIVDRSPGVFLNSTSDNTIRCSTISHNTVGIQAQASVAGLVVSWNEISGNYDAGIRNYTGVEINAENNYWGAADGPSNLGGSGDSYSGNVDADPFLTSLPPCLVTNVPPVADNLMVNTDEDAPVGIVLTASDDDGDSLTYSILDGPDHGTLTGTAPNLTYTPHLDYNGPDSFTFTANDGTDDSNVATVSITLAPVNDVPTASGTTLTATEDGWVEVDLRTLVADVETDVNDLTFTVGDGIGGSAVLLADGHTAQYEVGAGCEGVGAGSFTFTVTDRGDPDHPDTSPEDRASSAATISVDIIPAVSEGEVSIDAGIVRIGGTSADDVIIVTHTADGQNLEVTVNGVVEDSILLADVAEIRAWGRAGNDYVELIDLALTSMLHGGDDDDELIGAAGSDLILGGLGDDKLTGASGDDFLIGGDGSDRIVGSAGHDVLVAGDVACSITEQALWAALADWVDGREEDDGTFGDVLDETLITDGDFDKLTGSSGADLFIIGEGDKITDLKKAIKDGDEIRTGGVA